MNPQAQLESVWGWLGQYAWVVQSFLVILLTLIVGLAAKRLLQSLMRRVGASESVLDDALFRALLGPTRGLIWIVGISFAAHIIGRQTDSPLFDVTSTARDIGIIAMIAWFLTRFIRFYESMFIERKLASGEHVDRTFIDAVAKLLRASVMITAVLIALHTLGINIAGVVAFGELSVRLG